jgi:PAS domain-containing protein
LKSTLAVNPVNTCRCDADVKFKYVAVELEPLTPDDVKLISDLLPDAFILLSDSGSILTANAAAHELFRRDQLAGLALADLVTDPASELNDWLKHSTASRRMTANSFNLHTDGTGVPVG